LYSKNCVTNGRPNNKIIFLQFQFSHCKNLILCYTYFLRRFLSKFKFESWLLHSNMPPAKMIHYMRVYFRFILHEFLSDTQLSHRAGSKTLYIGPLVLNSLIGKQLCDTRKLTCVFSATHFGNCYFDECRVCISEPKACCSKTHLWVCSCHKIVPSCNELLSQGPT